MDTANSSRRPSTSPTSRRRRRRSGRRSIDPAFTRQYFFGRTIEIEPKEGGAFILRMPDGRVDVKGSVVDWSRRTGSR